MNDLYDGKKFFEIVNGVPVGPLDNIRYVERTGGNFDPGIKFCQVINGKVVQIFTEKEILVVSNG